MLVVARGHFMHTTHIAAHRAPPPIQFFRSAVHGEHVRLWLARASSESLISLALQSVSREQAKRIRAETPTNIQPKIREHALAWGASMNYARSRRHNDAHTNTTQDYCNIIPVEIHDRGICRCVMFFADRETSCIRSNTGLSSTSLYRENRFVHHVSR